MRPAVSVGRIHEKGGYLDTQPTIHHLPTNRHAAPLSDADFQRFLASSMPSDQDIHYFEGGNPVDDLGGSDPAPFDFGSMVNFDPEPVDQDNLDSPIGFPDATSHKTSSMQPGFGASIERCDEQGIAASG